MICVGCPACGGNTERRVSGGAWEDGGNRGGVNAVKNSMEKGCNRKWKVLK